MRQPNILRIAVIVAGVLFAGAAADAKSHSGEFAVPSGLRPQVEFWKRIFTTYSTRQIVIHDTERLDRVYSVLDFQWAEEQGEDRSSIDALMRESEANEKEQVRALLMRLHQGDSPATAEEQRIYNLFENDDDPMKFLRAAEPDRVRGQRGLRERFAGAIEIGHRYFREMEAIFAERGLPIELTRLPLIESCFNVRAYSKVGAAGMWQFMPSTGRRFMRVDEVIDERRDPIKSTRAAAIYLRENYDTLGTWPLAITAYNHGPAGISNAVDEVGTTNIETIIRYYRGPSFGFASRNFYPEFLAALEIERDHQRYFGRLVVQRPVATESVFLSHSIDINTAAQYAETDPDVLADLNPSLSPAVEDGRRAIPAGYALQVPSGAATGFEYSYSMWVDRQQAESRRASARRPKGRQVAKARSGKSTQVAKASRSKHKVTTAKRSKSKPAVKAKGSSTRKPKHVVHRVRRGQTIQSIARRYGSSVEQIRRHNGIRKSNSLREGQTLRIPVS